MTEEFPAEIAAEELPAEFELEAEEEKLEKIEFEVTFENTAVAELELLELATKDMVDLLITKHPTGTAAPAAPPRGGVAVPTHHLDPSDKSIVKFSAEEAVDLDAKELAIEKADAFVG